MITTKEEISKIIKMRKILENNYSLDEITNLDTFIRIKKDGLYIVINQNDIILQLKLNLFDNNEDFSFTTKFGELLKIAKTFTKKTDINIIINNNDITFEGNQDKDLVSEKIMVTKETKVNISTNINGITIPSIDLLTGLIACYKITKKMEILLEVDNQIKVSSKDGILKFICNSNDTILSVNFDYKNTNNNFFLEKEKIRLIYSTIQESKELDTELSTYQGLVIKTGDFTLWAKKSNKNNFDVEGLINNLENKLEFKKIENSFIDEKNINKRDIDERICYINDNKLTSDKMSSVFSDISIIKNGYSDKRISELLKIKSLDLEELNLFIENKYNILKVSNDFLTYYILPQKKTN